ncbi:hypothetical protein JW824_11680 [bacterium]|nr:hypothetical protein [bacterium]
MKDGKEIMRKFCWICTAFLLLSNLWAESNLVSVKKGGEGGRTWAVLYFDQDPAWSGVSQLQENKLSLYFSGNVGELNGSSLSLDPVKDRRVTINQISRSPAVFCVDIISEGNLPLVILKNESHVIIALNDIRLLDEKLSESVLDASVLPSSLVSVAPIIQNNQVLTTLQFDGLYQWKGYVRPSNKSAALLIQGAQLSNIDNQYQFTESALQDIRIVTDRDKPYVMRIVLFFNQFTHFTLVNRPQSFIIQTPYSDKSSQQIVQTETTAQPVFIDQRDVAAEPVSPSEFPREDIDREMVDDMVQGERQPEIESEPVSTLVSEDDAISSDESSDWTMLSDKMASIVEEIESENARQADRAASASQTENLSGAGQEEVSLIPWDREVTFRFSGTPIKDVLRLIATSNNLNIIIGEGVTGEVTMNLEGVTLKQALEKVVYMQDCEFIVDENIIIVKPMNVKYLGGMTTKVYRLKYADAKNVAVIIRRIVTNDTLVQIFYPEFLVFQNEEKISEYELQGGMGGMGGMGGTSGGGGTAMEAGMNRMINNPEAIQGIRRSSVLVVTDRPDKIREVDKVIAELDQMPVQFIIESRLVELRPSYNEELGIDWEGALSLMWNKNQVSDIDPGLHIQEGNYFGIDWELQTGELTPAQYFAVLDFLKEKTDSELKLNPRILAMNNEESSISVGTTVPIPRIQSGGVANLDRIEIEYKEINIQLNVAPHLGENGDITMYVNPVVEEITDWVDVADSRVPVTTKQSVNSIVTVKNGNTVVIGGLIKKQQYQLTRKIWFLGDLPLIGKLFQHDAVEDKVTELMIFITPKIVEMG